MPTFIEFQKLSGPDTNGQFGLSVALSLDGKTALINAPLANAAAGAAWVFIRDGEWINQDMLSVMGGVHFGWSVALSSDGNTALVGAPESNDDAGSATVFTRTGTAWTIQETLLAPTTGAGQEIGPGNFGTSVALSSDGNTALVGTPSNNPQGSISAGVGSVTVFIRTGTNWTVQQTLFGLTSGADKEIDLGDFGYGVALSSDGNTALVGAPFNNPSGSVAGVGSATVFTRKGTAWTNQETLLAATSGANEEIGPGNFGASVALSSNGDTALVGAPGDKLVGLLQTGVGAAWVFTRKGATWDSGQKLTAPALGAEAEIGIPAIGEGQFGWSVALSSDGALALIGGPGDNGLIGAAWAFDHQPAFLRLPAR
jgi:hypothetical protein